jgi:hypothetical protein
LFFDLFSVRFLMRFAYWRIQEQGKSCESRFMWAVRERECEVASYTTLLLMNTWLVFQE